MKKRVQLIFALPFFLFMLTFLEARPQAGHKGDASENAAIGKVLSLQEVQRENAFIDSLSGHKHGISILVLKRPINQKGFFLVQADYNGELRFEPYYNFYVYPPHMSIKVLDAMTDSLYSLTDWRKKEKGK
jgi:hypothetical protein